MSKLPYEGQVVFVAGGVAQFRKGVFYTGMEDPRWRRAIQWEVDWWLPMDAAGIAEAVRSWDLCSICRRPTVNGEHNHPCE